MLCPGKSSGASHAHAMSQNSHSAVGHDDKCADKWARELEKHQQTLNGTRVTAAGASADEPAVPDWPPCVDNTSCEIQLSLVEQKRKLLHQRKQASAKLQSSSRTKLRNGRSDARRTHSVLNSLDNRSPEEKFIPHRASANTSDHSRPQHDITYGTNLLHGAGSCDGWLDSVDDFKTDLDRSSRAQAYVPTYNPPHDIPNSAVIADKKQTGECELDANEEQTRKKLKRLQNLHGSQKSGTGTLSYTHLSLVW